MKMVDLRNFTDGVSPKYSGVPQPMTVYHSTEELYNHVEFPSIISNIYEFQEYALANKLNNQGWTDVYEHNIWLATHEKVIPEVMDIYGGVTYRLVNNKPVSTDNCYIRLNSLNHFLYNYLLWTSSGLFNISLANWGLSAGIKTQFIKTKQGAKKEGVPYVEKLDKVLARKATSVRDMQVLMLLINPLSDTFLNVDMCMRKVYPEIRKKDRAKYLNTERFKNLFINQLGKLMPDLMKGVQNKNTPDDIGEYIKKMREHALEKGTTEDQAMALNVTLKLGYSDQIINTGNDMSAFESNKFTPLIGTAGGTMTGQIEQGAGAQNIIKDDSKADDEDTDKLPPESVKDLETYTDDDISMNDEEFKEAMEETGAIDGFIITDEDDKKPE